VTLIVIAAAALLMACFRILKGRSTPFDRKELARHSRAAEEARREWQYPFE
jgi:hypothetical protein